MRKQSKDELLDHYATREPRRFFQFDGFAGIVEDSVMHGDNEGHAVMLGETYELMGSSFKVRVLVDENAEAGEVAALLRKIVSDIESGSLTALKSGVLAGAHRRLALVADSELLPDDLPF